MKTINLKLTGIRPLIMHNSQLSDPLSPVTKDIKEISSKKVKTDADHAAIAEIEYYGGLYYDHELGPPKDTFCAKA